MSTSETSTSAPRVAKSAKKKKPARPKARRPRGFEDKTAAVSRVERQLVARACAVYETHGFQPLETSALEHADALGAFLPDVDRPNAGVFALQDDDEQWLALRYDLTAPLARHVAEHFDALPKPFRRYQAGPVWRNEKPGPGRFREFIQCDADSVGAPGPAADAEMIALAVKVMRAAGLATGEFAVRYNDRRILDAMLAGLGVPEDGAGALQRLRVLRAIDKWDRLGADGVAALLGAGRKDESGDFTEGAGLNAQGADAVMALLHAAQAPAGGERLAAARDAVAAAASSSAAQACFADMAAIAELAETMGAGDDAVFDPAVVRGLGYYTGPVFEAELLLKVADEKGRPVQVGSIGGGGRYDDLVARFKGQPVPATGFSFGVTRFAAALAISGRLAADAAPLAVVLALEPDQMADYFAIAEKIRAQAGIPAEVYVGGANMGKQLKYADKRGARFAVIIGEDERKARRVTVKDLALGAALAKDIASNEEWRRAQPAQEAVTRSQLVPWIKRALKNDGMRGPNPQAGGL